MINKSMQIIIILVVHDGSALFTIYLCRGEETEGSRDHTLFVSEGNTKHNIFSFNIVTYLFSHFTS